VESNETIPVRFMTTMVVVAQVTTPVLEVEPVTMKQRRNQRRLFQQQQKQRKAIQVSRFLNTAASLSDRYARLGIGGFHVKIRGQRRRQDPAVTADPTQDDNLHDELAAAGGKRKRDRRALKKKSMFEEQMPPEMQEAFFGSDLAERSRLMAQQPVTVAPLQLPEHSTTSNGINNNDYTIKLDHETINRFLIKKASRLAAAVKEEQRQAPVTPAPAPAPVLPSGDDETDIRKFLQIAKIRFHRSISFRE
jgi:hypothetical protein